VLAERQHGVVTLDQLRNLGYTRRMVASRVEKGRFAPVLRGVYAIGPRLSVRWREMAAVLQGGGSAVLSHRSAAALWGILTLPEGPPGADPGWCEISLLDSGRGRRAPGVVAHRVSELPDEDRSERDGIPVTTPERTVLDLAALASRARAASPARSAPGAMERVDMIPLPPFTPRDMERVVARAEREGLISLAGLRARLEGSPGRGGTRLLRRILEIDGGPAFTRSEAESRLLARIRRSGLPAPRVNARLGRWELDFYWEEAHLAVEVDGYTHHGTRGGFERDRAKDADLAARGVLVIRVTWRQLRDTPEAVIGQVARALGRAEERSGVGLPGCSGPRGTPGTQGRARREVSPLRPAARGDRQERGG
jgi:very-short-patch-repair endonuclease